MALGVITVGRSVIQYVIEPGWKTKQNKTNLLRNKFVSMHQKHVGKKEPERTRTKNQGREGRNMEDSVAI